MTVYVDDLREFGWVLRGRKIASCHLFTDSVDLTELHELARKIGMKVAWFQNSKSAPHYDLTPSRRADAVAHGAREADTETAVRIWRERRAAVAALAIHSPSDHATHNPETATEPDPSA